MFDKMRKGYACRPWLPLAGLFVLAYAAVFARSLPVVLHWLFPHAVSVQAPESAPVAAAAAVGRRDTLKLVTYNILDNPIRPDERMPVLLRLLKDSDADVIALQEVDAWSHELLSLEAWAGSYYQVDGSADCGGQYILSRFPLNAATCYPLPGKQGRTVLIAVFDLRGRRLAVATSHMESYLEDGPTRARQLDLIFDKLAAADDAVFMGDLNCGDGESENNHIPAAYADLWRVLRPNAPGYTWDNEKSDMAGKSDERFPGEPSRRLDRILLRSDRWKPLETRIVGDEPVVPGKKDLFPSDHFGVYGAAAWRQ
jgi:endonuclease/exonuclease/phosphatase family metal-dependent hydrolase